MTLARDPGAASADAAPTGHAGPLETAQAQLAFAVDEKTTVEVEQPRDLPDQLGLPDPPVLKGNPRLWRQGSILAWM